MNEPREALRHLLNAPVAIEKDDEDRVRGILWARNQYWEITLKPLGTIKGTQDDNV